MELTFAELELQFVDSDGEAGVHSEAGGPHRVVFLNDSCLLDVESGDELLYKPMRGRHADAELCGCQVVVLGAVGEGDCATPTTKQLLAAAAL